MKRKIVLILLIIVLFVIILLLIVNRKELVKVDAICEIETFTLTDAGTEIEVTLETEENINQIELDLYDTNKKIIKTIKKDIDNIKNKKIKVETNKKYPQTADIRCTVYKFK